MVTAVSASTLVSNYTVQGAGSLLMPFTDLVFSFFPKLGVSGKEIKTGVGPIDNISEERIQPVLQRLNKLADFANLPRKVSFCFAETFSSFGWRLSISEPVIGIPRNELFGKGLDGKNGDYGQKSADLVAPEDITSYSNDETDFLVLRSLVQLRKNDSFLKLIAKASMVAAIVLLQLNPFIWPISLGILLLAIIGYFVVDYSVQRNLDTEAVKCLSNALETGGLERAVEIGVATLKKLQAQNLELKGKSRLFNAIIDDEGNNRLTPSVPAFSKRIKAVEAMDPKLPKVRKPPLSADVFQLVTPGR